MKKMSVRTLLFALLVAISVACFIFINTVSVVEPTTKTSTNVEVELEEQEEEDTGSSMVLPDIELVKKLIDKSTMYVPSS